MIEVVYRVIKTKQFKGKDALKRAKLFTKEIKKKRSTDEVELFNIEGNSRDGNTNGCWTFSEDTGKFSWIEMDG